ncbi:MAG: hypothetical protein K9N06_08535 [Candidatus Cloacimonetes bacterium]|nr:hypothetical protein [Candidatus Cloacimonadota bacterium]
MAYGQTMMVLLAILLFSTMMLGYYNNLFRWYDIHNREYARFQALKVADGVFQEIEFEYISDRMSFSQLANAWQDSLRVLTYSDIDYNAFVQANWCDSVGTDASPGSGFLRFDLRVGCAQGSADTIWIGTSTAPLQKLIADMGI